MVKTIADFFVKGSGQTFLDPLTTLGDLEEKKVYRKQERLVEGFNFNDLTKEMSKLAPPPFPARDESNEDDELYDGDEGVQRIFDDQRKSSTRASYLSDGDSVKAKVQKLVRKAENEVSSTTASMHLGKKMDKSLPTADDVPVFEAVSEKSPDNNSSKSLLTELKTKESVLSNDKVEPSPLEPEVDEKAIRSEEKPTEIV